MWNFGGQLPNTTQNFGKDAQYGEPDLSWYGGTNISSVAAQSGVRRQMRRSAVAASEQ